MDSVGNESVLNLSTSVYIYNHICTFVCVRKFMVTLMFVLLCVEMFARFQHKKTHVYGYSYVYMYLYIYIYAHIFVYLYKDVYTPYYLRCRT